MSDSQIAQLTQRQERFVEQYKALRDAYSAAATRVELLEVRFNLGSEVTYDDLNSDQQALYDQARHNTLDAHAALTAFVRDTPLIEARLATQADLTAADPLRSNLDRGLAKMASQSYWNSYSDFLAVKEIEGWTYPEPISFQIGAKLIISNEGGVHDVVNATGAVSGISESVKQWFANMNAAGADQAELLRQNGIDLTDYQACVAILGDFKSRLLLAGFPTPNIFKNSPPLPGMGTVGEELYERGLGSVWDADEKTCRFFFPKSNARDLFIKYGGADQDFLDQFDGISGDVVAFNVPTEVFSKVIANESVLDQIPNIESADALDASLSAALVSGQSLAGATSLFTKVATDSALNALDGADLGFGRFHRTSGNDFTIDASIGGRDVVLLASLDVGVTSDAGGGFSITGVSSIGGQQVSTALDPQDLAAFGLTFADLTRNGVSASAANVIGALDPAVAVSAGWSQPTVVDAVVPQGFTRTVELANGLTAVSTYDSDRRLVSVTESYTPNAGQTSVKTYAVNGDGSRTLVTDSTRLVSADGSYVGSEVDVRTRQVYAVSGDANGNTARVLNEDATKNLQAGDAANVLLDVSNLVSSLKAGQPIPVLASGIRLLNDFNVANGSPLGNLGAADTIAAGALSFYNLYNAFNSNDDFAKLNSTLSAISYANQAIIGAGLGGAANSAISGFLNGAKGGISAGGSVGVLPVLGLVASIKAEDPIGIAMSLGTMIQGSAFLTGTPVGWALIAAEVLKAIFSDDSPPDAWGIAKVTFGEGFNNLDPLVQASGENFGPDRVRAQLQGVVDVVKQIIQNNNASASDSSQTLGIIPQRLPGLTYHAREFQDQGYAVTDVDPLTGAQRGAQLRFDDNGQLFGVTPDQLTPEERAMISLPGTDATPLIAYMLNSAMDREAIAPIWEVQTAKMQGQAGDPNAGLTEEERAAKAGYAAPVDTQYAQAHSSDPNAANRRAGHFMVVGLDLSGDGRIAVESIAQEHADGKNITFDWDHQGYQKATGWVGAQDGLLVLDHNFNQSADDPKELFSNPLVADAGKGLRILAAYDGNGDGVIDARDPVFAQLRVWQDLDQDGNNTHVLTVGSTQSLAQDETNGQRELRTLQEVGIASIDYANGRYHLEDGSVRLIATETLEAQDEGTRYTPVGAGIKIEATNGVPQILINQVQSEATVYDGLQISAAGETIGTPEAPLYEDGQPGAYDPNAQGGPLELVISAAQLLQNDTWAGANGAAAGLALTSVRSGAHTTVTLRQDGNVSLRLDPNYNGPADFFYTVAVPGYESVVQPREARVALNVTPVNDVPSVTATYAPDRSIFGYAPLAYSYTTTTGAGENTEYIQHTGTVVGEPIYTPYVEHVPEAPIYEWQWVGTGENMELKQVVVGHTPAYDVSHDAPVASDKPNTGKVLASDVDGGSFSFQVVSQGAYGQATVDATGNWSYVGSRPQDAYVNDINGDGARDWIGPVDGSIANQYSGNPNVYSNRYAGDEPAPFQDYFTVRVTDNSDPTGQTFRDVQIAATHYGPAPLPVIADSGGKKPIAIDLNGDGFHFTDVDDSNVFYQVNGDGWKRRISWIKPGDGLLAYDKDGNGKIEGADEISFVPYAAGQQTDLAALRAAFDSNGDGRFDNADAKWASFGVWQDANSNGITDPGEYKSLDALGITSIDLQSDGQFRVIDGQTVYGIGTAHMGDGTSRAIADVSLRYRDETQVSTTNSDGSTTTTTVPVPLNNAPQEFVGTAQADLVFGTKASDKFRMDAGNDMVLDDGGDDVVDAGAGDDTVYSGADNDVVYGGSGNDTVYTGAGNDLVFGDQGDDAGDDLIMLEEGNDIAFGGGGNDFISGGEGNDVISGNAGNDKLFGELGWDVLFGQEGSDELWGMDGNDLLYGGSGNDRLAGGAGDDTMEGGAGDDTYDVDSEGDQVIEAADEGNDTVQSTITYTLGDALEDLRLLGDTSIDGTGNSRDNFLAGNDASNTLLGLAGNDTLDGGRGPDNMIGGAGDDTYYVESLGDTVLELAGEGVDTVRSHISYTLTDEVENLSLLGLGAIDGTGNALDNVLVGNAADNKLDGGLGGDLMRGNEGDDTYLVDSAADVIQEAAAEGDDTVVASVSYGLADNIENLILVGDAAAATGNALNNVLAGTASANVLDGGAGADTMSGGMGDDTYVVDNKADLVMETPGEGNDTVLSSVDYILAANVETLVLQGQAVRGTGNALANELHGNSLDNVLDGSVGADSMAGGAGDDTYLVDSAADAVIEGAAEGNDTVISSVTYTLAGNVENLTLAGDEANNAIGNDADNLLIGNDAANLIDGGAGADRMSGGGGNDGYIVDDARDMVIEEESNGVDIVVAGVDFALSDNVENLTLVDAAVVGTGNALTNVIEGNGLGNILDGREGADQMLGRAGDDTYIVDDSADVVIEGAGEGCDTVLASADFELSENVENLTLAGTATTAIGNGLDNQLRGTDQANLLDGGAGADWMAGGQGDDTYLVDNAVDQVVENPGEGNDTVQASVTYRLADHVENLALTGAADIEGVGNGLDNVLTGNAGSNRLDGGTGADVMAGGAGDDTYVVDQAGDQVVELFASGLDTVLAGIDYVLPENVESLRLTGQAEAGIGNDLDNRIVGNELDNTLDGGTGADVMVGGAGNDRYIVDNAADIVNEQVEQGVDAVYSSVRYVLPTAVESLTLTGAEDIDATGNESNNALYGNSGNNVLDGGAGSDRMDGGKGDDTYVVDDADDAVIETSDAGTDTVRASVSYGLSDNVEALVLTGSAVAATGNALDNVVIGNGLNNFIDGGAGADDMAGGEGDDTYVVDNVADVISEAAGEGSDTVLAAVSYSLSENVEDLSLTGADNIDAIGNALDNVLTGNAGNNVLTGGAGDDTYLYSVGGGLDTIVDASGCETLRFGPGLTLGNVALRIVVNNGLKVAQIRVLDASGNEMADQGLDFVMSADAQNRMDSPIERFVFDDGRTCDWSELLIQSTSLFGTRNADLLIGGRNDDLIWGDRGDDALYGGSGRDTLIGGNGADILFGQGGEDRLYGGNDADELYGGAGADEISGDNGNDYVLDLEGDNAIAGGNNNDVLQAGAGVDRLDGGNDADMLDAGAGADLMTGGNGDDWIAAGRGNDVIDSGTGRDLLAFNRGDGSDTLATSGRDAISLGGGIRLADLALSKAGNDLVLDTGGGDSIRIQGWYAHGSQRVDLLQLITVGGDYDPTSGDRAVNRKVELFDFARVVHSFDAARAKGVTNDSGWAAMNSLLDAHLIGTDCAALGGDLSFQYATQGSLTGVSLSGAQASLRAGASDLQLLKDRSLLDSGTLRLA